MDVRELELALRNKLGDKVHYIGVYTSDNFPTVAYSKKPIMFIVNTLRSTSDINIVGHWIGIYIEYHPMKRVFFFDSFGIPPIMYHNTGFSQFINSYRGKKMKISYTKKQLQPDNSIKCGLYVLLFIHFTSHYGINTFMNYSRDFFSKNSLAFNDKSVTRYYFKHLANGNCLQWKSGVKRAITYKECIAYL